MRCLFIRAADAYEVQQRPPAVVREMEDKAWPMEVAGVRDEFFLHSQRWQDDAFAIFLPARLSVIACARLLDQFRAAKPELMPRLA